MLHVAVAFIPLYQASWTPVSPPALPSSATSPLRVDGRRARRGEGQLGCASRCGFVHVFFEALLLFVVQCVYIGVSTSSPRAVRFSQRELTASLQAGLTLTTNGPAPD